MTMPHHALDITLPRLFTPTESHWATRTMPFAANHDATHLLALVHAKTPSEALNRLRDQIGGLLPIDVITTHYPDSGGQILLNVDFPPATYAALQTAADGAGQPRASSCNWPSTGPWPDTQPRRPIASTGQSSVSTRSFACLSTGLRLACPAAPYGSYPGSSPLVS
ncbi:hypothetical protein [Streptomyces sp. NPDC059134]|uniref:hypothetical protein n=1 Tax=Streptomyces sp. NPDC059134 TaxID=3346738 RepID=UPI003696465F